MDRVGFVDHWMYLKHNPGFEHLEKAARLRMILRGLRGYGLWGDLVKIGVGEGVDLGWVLEVHDGEYIERFRRCKGGYLDFEECGVNGWSYKSSLYGVGGVLEGIDWIMRGEVDRVFCGLRPPGHHAHRGNAKGFCFLNHIAIGARYLEKRYGLRRIFIVDWDVHHGDGTQSIFWEDGNVFFSSIHEDSSRSYPGTGYASEVGFGAGKNYTLNCLVDFGVKDEEYLEIFEGIILRMEDFCPEFILISAGFDGHGSDPLGNLDLSESVYKKMTERVVRVARKHCGGRVLSILEGGYNLVGLRESVCMHIRGLMGF